MHHFSEIQFFSVYYYFLLFIYLFFTYNIVLVAISGNPIKSSSKDSSNVIIILTHAYCCLKISLKIDLIRNNVRKNIQSFIVHSGSTKAVSTYCMS